MKRRAKRKASKPEVNEAFVTLFKGVFLSQMKGMLKSEDTEERYVALQDRIRKATEEEMAILARKAAEYYVAHANPSPGKLSREEVDGLKKAAFDHALNS